MDYKNLIFEGGGMKGIAYARVPEILEKYGILNNIEKVAGSSAGSIAALLIALKYNPSEIKDILTTMSFEDFKDSHTYTTSIWNLFMKAGINDGSFFEEWIKNRIRFKTASKESTFIDIYRLTGIELVITGTNINLGKTEYFSYKTTPNMPVWIAMRISISIPIFFTPIIYNGFTYIDGGMLSNYPIWIFDREHSYESVLDLDGEYNRQTLGFKLVSEENIHKDESEIHTPIKSVTLMFNLLLLLLNYIDKINDIYEYSNRTVMINVLNISSTNFKLDKRLKDMLIENGGWATDKFLHNKKIEMELRLQLSGNSLSP